MRKPVWAVKCTKNCALLQTKTNKSPLHIARDFFIVRRNSSKYNYPLFPDTPAFLKILLNASFPLPHGVSPIPFPLCTSFEGTHGTAPQGATLGTRIDRGISLIMPLVRQRKEQHSSAHLYYTHKASTHKRQANDSVIYKMKAQSFV